MSDMDSLGTSVNDLDAKVGDLSRQVQKLERTIAAQDRRAQKWRMVVACFLTGIIIVLLATVPAMVKVSLDNRAAIDANNQRWCPVVAPLAPRADDPPPQGTPEQQARSLRIRDAFTRLVHDFRC